MTYHRLSKRYSLIIMLLTVPLISTTVLPSPEPSLIKDAQIVFQKMEVSHPTIVAGGFFSLEIHVTSEANKITVVAYRGENIPDERNRSILNYYRWEYNHGSWYDRSGYKKSYIKPEKCYFRGDTYLFYISLDTKAERGQWRIKVSVDNRETKTFSTVVKPVIPLFTPGVVSVKSLNNKRSLLNKLFKRFTGRELNSRLRKLLVSLKKEGRVYAAYIANSSNKLTLPLLLDPGSSPAEMMRIKTMVFKKTQRLFPHTSVHVILLNKAPMEEAYNLLVAHKTFYEKNPDEVKRFEHDIVAAYLDHIKAPPECMLREIQESAQPASIHKLQEHDRSTCDDSAEGKKCLKTLLEHKPRVAELTLSTPSHKGVVPPPKHLAFKIKGFVKPSTVKGVLSFFVVFLLIFPAFMPALLAGPPPPLRCKGFKETREPLEVKGVIEPPSKTCNQNKKHGFINGEGFFETPVELDDSIDVVEQTILNNSSCTTSVGINESMFSNSSVLINSTNMVSDNVSYNTSINPLKNSTIPPNGVSNHTLPERNGTENLAAANQSINTSIDLLSGNSTYLEENPVVSGDQTNNQTVNVSHDPMDEELNNTVDEFGNETSEKDDSFFNTTDAAEQENELLDWKHFLCKKKLFSRGINRRKCSNFNLNLQVESYVSRDGYIYTRETTAEEGEKIVFKLVVTNTGEATLNIFIKDVFSEELIYLGDATPEEPDVVANNHLYWYLPRLQPGETFTTTFHAVVNECGRLVNRVTVTGCFEGKMVYDRDSTVVEVSCSPVMLVDKKVWNGTAWVDSINTTVGKRLRFNITVTNSGSNPYMLYDIFIRDKLPEMLHYNGNSTLNNVSRAPDAVNNSSVVWAVPSTEQVVCPGESLFIEFDVYAEQVGESVNIANVSSHYCDPDVLYVYGEDDLEINVQPPPPKYKGITPMEAYHLINSSQNILLLDVRSEGEYYSGHIHGAISTPLALLSKNPDSLPDVDKNITVIVYSRSGYLGQQACEIIVNESFEHVYNLEGGLLEWIEKGFPVTKPRYPDPVHNAVYEKLKNGTPVFLFFYHADYHEYCIDQKTLIDELRVNYEKNISFIYVDGKNNSTVIQNFDVRVYPTMYIVVDYNDLGFLYTEFSGFTNKTTLHSILDFVVNNTDYSLGLYNWQRSMLIHHHPPVVPVDVAKQVLRTGKARVIIRYRDTMEDDFFNYTERLKMKGFIVTQEFPEEGMVAGVVSYTVFQQLKKDSDIEEFITDRKFTVFLNESLPLIRFDEAEQEFGLTGEGVRICMLDTGVDSSVVSYSYGYDFVNDDDDPFDDHGHGTMVASILKTVAPDAELVVAKVIDKDGVGYESDVLAGLKYCIQQNPDIILFSIGTKATSSGFYDENPVAKLCNEAVEQGVFVVAAAGNDGSKNLTSPACASKVFSVGATDDYDRIANFSNVNPTLDMFAPGVNITTSVGTSSGTSLSAPFVAGAAALVLENESLIPAELSYRLRSTGKPIEYVYNDSLKVEIPRLDVYNALADNKTMEPYNYSWWWHDELSGEETGEYEPLETCFPPGTLIAMADGSFKPIEDVKVGDLVLSYDLKKQRFVVEKAVGIEEPVREGVYDINNGLISPTCDHPLFVRKPNGEMGWAAVDPVYSMKVHPFLENILPLEVGDELFTLNKTWVKVESIRFHPGPIQVYTLDVRGTNNFFANGTLAHNTCTCFLPGTKINMANGTYKHIEDIKVGDQVKVFNNQTMSVEDATVTATMTKMHDDVHEIYLENGKTLRPTANHPFWTKEKGWATISGLDELGLGAGKLEIGDHVYQLSPEGNLKEVKIINIIPIQGNYLTYNLVDMKHGTFLAEDIVTHNTCTECVMPGTPISMADGTFKPIEEIKKGDLVKVFDVKNWTVKVAPVKHGLFTKLHDNVHEIHFSNGEILRVGDDHYFYTVEKGWANVNGLDKLHIGADKLSIGDHVYHTKPDGTLEIVKINNIVPVEGEYLTFDLANMKFHTYLVDDFVTHNTLCFMPGTPINLADGGYKNIEDVKVGDKVKVFNEKTGEIKDATVNCTQIKIHDNVYEIYLEDGRVLKPTANHPFWTKEKGWATISGLDEMGMGSGKLEIGDHLYSIQADGSLKEIKIVNIIPVEGEYLTYNFVDMKYGTFIADDIITHNTCCFLPGTKVNLANGSYKNVEDVKVGDVVKVFNEETGELEDAVVKVIHAGIHNDVYELYLNNGKILRPTANHPFWTEGKGWASISGEDELGIGADRLKVGDYIYQVTSNGNLQKVKVDAIIPVFGSYYSYNLINMSHGTFIAEDVITHNSCCFPAGTRIRMGDGTTKAIEDIKVGDRVLSYDVEHDRYVVSNVTKLIVKVREGVYDINNGLISPTCDHPLFVRKPNGEMGWAAVNPKQSKVMYKWRNAMPLQIGDQLFTAEGKWVKVYSIKYQPGTLTTYTFVVDAEVHDYFANNLLVSNTLICCFMPDTPITMADGTHKQIKDVKIGDKVKVFNEGNRTVEDALVKQMSMVMHDDVYELHLSNGEILRPTANHPFYTKEKGWATISGLDELGLGAGKLEIGDHVYQLSPEGNLKEVKIINIIPIQGNYLTYNLVDMKHGTFLADDIITHNTCFLAGTNITMANGSFKRIEDVRVGDLVKAFDENTGRVVVSRVTKLYHHTSEEMSDYYLVVNDGLLRVTPEHMLYVDGVWRGAWTIKIGDNLLDINGSRVPVFSVKRVYRRVPTYNLEIERYHTFYANDVLVHNAKCFMPDTPITMSDGAHKPIKDVKIGDKVKVFNEEDMTVEDAPVTSIMTKMHNDVYEVYLSNGKILKPTANHPFWTKEKGWATIDGLDDMNIGAKKLEVGDHVYQLSSDETTLEEVEVTNIVPVEGDYLTYNFVDMKYGTFLADDVVTHNTGNQAPSASYYDGATNIFAGKKVTTIRTEHTDPDGAGDVDDCRLRIGVNGGNYFTLNYNVDTNSYGCNNGCDWVSLSGCSVTETSITNGYRLTWQFIVDWDFPFDDTDYDVGVRTLDEQGADSGWQWSEAGTYTFENDLEVVSFTAQLEITDWDGDHDGKIEDNEWFAGGHPVAASGTVEYQGSSQTFDSSYASGVSVQLFYDTNGDGTPDDLGDSYDDTTISSGSFSIPTYTPGTFPVLQTNAHFDVAIQGIPSGGSDVTAASIEITSKRDNQPPPVFGSWTQDPDGDSGGDGYAPNTGYEDDSTCQGDFLECSDGSGSGIRYYYIKRNGGSYGPADADGLNVQCTLASGWNDIYYKLEDQVGNIAEGDTGENIYYGTTAPSDMDIDITGNVDGYPSSDPSWIIDKTDIPSGTLYINTDEPDQTWGITMDASGSWGSGGAWKVVFEAGWGASQKTDTSSPYTSYSYHSNTGSEPDIWTKIINNCGIVETVTLTTTVETTDPDTTVTDIPDGDTGPSTITGGSTDNLRVAAVKIYIKNTTDGTYWTGSSWGGLTWLDATADDGSFDETSESWTYDCDSAGVTWDSKSYEVQAKAYDIVMNVDPSPATDTFTLTINNAPTASYHSGADPVHYAGKTYSFTTVHGDSDGRTDIKYAYASFGSSDSDIAFYTQPNDENPTVTVMFGSSYLIGTPTCNVVPVDADTFEITWTYTIDWDWTHDDQAVIDYFANTQDYSDALAGWDHYDYNGDYENEVILKSVSFTLSDSAYSEDGNTDLTEGEWFRGGVGVKATGVVCYEGATTVYPPSDACDVQLWADGVDLGETYDDDTLGSNGEFDTGFYQTPSTSGIDNDYDFKVTLTDFVSGATEGSGGADPDINSARDNQAPTISSPSVSESSDYIYASGTTIYYGDDMGSAQSFTVQGSSSDGSGVGLDKATFSSNELGSPGDDTTPASWSGVYNDVESTDTWTGTITVTVYDKVGNINTQGFTVNRDTTNPVFGSFNLDADTDSDGGNDIDPDTGWYDDLTIQGDFSGCSDTGSGIRGYQIRTDTHTWGNEDADGVNVGCTAGEEGTWDINYRIYDNVGNSVTGDTTVDVSIDTTPPTLDDAMSAYEESGDTDEMYGDVGTNTFYFSNSFDSDGTATFTCTFTDSNKWKVDFGSWGGDDPSEDTTSPYQGTYTVNNADTSGTITVLVYDKAGNSASASITCTEDVDNPTISVTGESESSPYLYAAYGTDTEGVYGSGMGTSLQSYTITGMASDGTSGVASVTDDTTFGDNPSNSGSATNWEFIYQIDADDNGDVTITYTAKDNVGNTDTVTYTFYEDNSNPSITDAMSSYQESGDTDEVYGDISTNTFYFSNSFDTSATVTFTATGSDTGKAGVRGIDFGAWGGDNPPEDSDSPFTGQYTVDSSDTSGSITVTIYDNVNNSASASITCTEDSSAADTTVNDVPDGADGPDSIYGGSTDNIMVSGVSLYIKNTTDGTYWTGSGWSGSETWLTANANDSSFDSSSEDWNYDTSSISWSSGKSFEVKAKALDEVGNEDSTPATDTFSISGSPTVVTNDATGVEETNATLHGTLSDDGGETCTVRFEYGTTISYGTNTSNQTKTSGQTFSTSISGLTSGDLYHFRAYANNTAGSDTGVDKTFFTKPQAPTSLTETDSTSTSLSYSWTKATVGSGATAYTRIQYKTGGYPTSINDGTNTYNSTGATDDTTSLTPGTHYYLSAWTWGTEGGLGAWSDSYDTMDAWTNPGDPTSVSSTQGTNWINITFTHGTNGEYTMVRRNATGSADYPADRSSGVLVANTTNGYANDTGLSRATTYYYSLWTWDPDGGKWCVNRVTYSTTTLAETPTVVTNDATGIEETNATLHGTLSDDGGETCTVRFEYGTTISYGTNTSNQTKTSGHSFAVNVSGLTRAELYHYRAYANNTLGSDTGVDKTFVTKPWPPENNSFDDTGYTNSSITLGWTKETGHGGTIYTYIRYQQGSTPPSSRTTGTFLCNTTGTTNVSTSLNPGTKYAFSAWTYYTEGGVGQWSDNYSTCTAYTSPGNPTGLTSTNRGDTWINLTFTHGSGGTVTMVVRNESGYANYPSSRTNGTEVYNGTNTWANDTGLATGVTYYYSAWTYDPESGYWSDGYDTYSTPTGNTPPYVTGVTITADHNFTLDDLTGNGTYHDDDDDPESGSLYQWWTNESGSWQKISGATSTTLDANLTKEGCWYKFEYTPCDGIDYGNPVNSTPLKIQPLAETATYTDIFNVQGNLTVTGGGTLSLGSTTLTLSGTVKVQNGGTLNGGTGAHTIGALKVESGGTYNATTSIIYITGEDTNGYALDIDGVFVNNSGTVEINTNGDTNIDITPASGGIKDLVVDMVSQNQRVLLQDNCSISGTLTVDEGVLDTNNHPIHVNSKLYILSGGTFDCSGDSVDHTVGALDMDTLSTFIGSSSSTLIVTSQSDGLAVDILGNFTSNGCTLEVKTPVTSHVNLQPSCGSVYNLVINSTSTIEWEGNTYISNNLTIQAGVFKPNTGGSSLTVDGDVTVSGGTLGGSASGTWSFGSLTLSSGTVSATSGIITITSESNTGYAVDLDAVFTNNSGTLKITTNNDTYIDITPVSGGVYNLIINTSGYTVTSTAAAILGNDLTVQTGTMVITNDLTVDATSIDSGGVFNITNTATFTMKNVLTLNGEFNVINGNAVDVNLTGTKFNLTNAVNVSLHTVSNTPSDPSNLQNIGKYVNLTSCGTSSTVDLNITYLDSDLGDMQENTLVMYEYNESTSTWVQAPNTGVNTVTNHVWANSVTSFSIYAPLGESPNQPPVINNIDLRNTTGSKLNNNSLLDVNKEYYFLINITDPDGWEDINYINITAWYDNGNDSSVYNQTQGGNLNMFLQYKNTTGTAEYNMLWPHNEVTKGTFVETIINTTTREIKLYFTPLSQVRYAPGDGSWSTTSNTTDDLYSWNVNVSVTDNSSAVSWVKSEYGVYRYTHIDASQDWVDVLAKPGENDTSSIVTITYSSNYGYNISIWFTENLSNQTTGDTIQIANNVYLLASTDPNDDITNDKTFTGVGENNAVDIINNSGVFQSNGTTQTVDVQFKVYIPYGTMHGFYRANVGIRIEQDN